MVAMGFIAGPGPLAVRARAAAQSRLTLNRGRRNWKPEAQRPPLVIVEDVRFWPEADNE